MKENRNRFTIIDNDLIDAFAKINLSPYEWRVIFAIIRYSYGWNKEEATLTYSQIESFCQIKKCHISRTIQSLLKKQIIIKEGKEYRLQKDYKKWGVPVEEVPVEVTKSSSTGNKIVPVEELKTAKKPSKINNLQHAKYIFKNIYNNLSNTQGYPGLYIYRETSENKKERDFVKDNFQLRERLLRELKKYFPNVDNIDVENISNEKIDYFIYLIEQNKINPDKIINPAFYMQSNKFIVKQSFLSLLEREAERRRLERQKAEEIRKQREEYERYKKEEADEVKQLAKIFRVELEKKQLTSVSVN